MKKKDEESKKMIQNLIKSNEDLKCLMQTFLKKEKTNYSTFQDDVIMTTNAEDVQKEYNVKKQVDKTKQIMSNIVKKDKCKISPLNNQEKQLDNFFEAHDERAKNVIQNIPNRKRGKRGGKKIKKTSKAIDL